MYAKFEVYYSLKVKAKVGFFKPISQPIFGESLHFYQNWIFLTFKRLWSFWFKYI